MVEPLVEEQVSEAEEARAEERAAWRDLLRHFWSLMRELWFEIGDDRVISVAAGVTFYAVLAMVPAITALVSLFGLVADPSDSEGIFLTASGFLPSDAAQLLTDQAVRIAGKADEKLSAATMIGIGRNASRVRSQELTANIAPTSTMFQKT